jgi:flagellar biosynthesis/type III secretory pathway M-ring protein FliF/YscJ
VRNAVGAQPGNDNVFVTCVKFENPVVQLAMAEMSRRPLPWQQYTWWFVIAVVVVAGIMLTTSLVKILQDADHAAAARLRGPGDPDGNRHRGEEFAAEAVRVNDLLSRLEGMTKTEPSNFSKLVKTWLGESNQDDKNSKKGR